MGKDNEKAWRDFISVPGFERVDDVERQDFSPKYLLDRVEELAVQVYSLESERDDLEKKLEVVTGERDTSRQMLIAERETLQAHRNASSETITHLVGLKNALESRLDTVTAERDALKAQLEQEEDEHIHELGNVGLDLEQAEHEIAIYKPLLTAVCTVVTEDVPGDLVENNRRLLERAMVVAEISGFVFVGVENDYDKNLREGALEKIRKELRIEIPRR